MKKNFLFIIFLLVIISCDYNPCNEVLPEGCIFPKIYWIKFYPEKVKIGDTVTIIYEKENKETVEGLNYNTDFEVTSAGEMKYVGNYSEISLNYPNEESRITKGFTCICPEKNSEENGIEVTHFISLTEQLTSSAKSKIIELKFKIPENARSGYVWTIDPMHFAKGGCFSEEKLIIVDENGNEITE